MPNYLNCATECPQATGGLVKEKISLLYFYAEPEIDVNEIGNICMKNLVVTRQIVINIYPLLLILNP